MSIAASDVAAFSPFPRRHPVYDWRKEGCIGSVFFARFQESVVMLPKMYRLDKRILPKLRTSYHRRRQPVIVMNAYPSSPSNPPPPQVASHETAGRTTISEKKKVLDQISRRIEQTEQYIKSLQKALKPGPPGFGRIIVSGVAAFLVVAHAIMLLRFPTLEGFMCLGIPFFILITHFSAFVELYPPMYSREGWLQFGALIGCYASLAWARLGWFYSWLTVKD